MTKRQCSSFEQKFLHVLEKAEGSILVWILLLPLIPLSYLYSFLSACHRKYRLMRRLPAPLPTITIGNVTAGGTGKTPLIIQLFLEKALDPKKTIYISRGYKSEKRLGASFSATGRDLDGSFFGDEAAQIARRFPEVLFIKAENGKAKAVQDAGQFKGRECVIVDDGLQHDEIEYALQIATVDSTNPLGFGWHLPRGLLRESPYQRLKKVDFIVLTNASPSDPQFMASWKLMTQFNKPMIAVKSHFCRFFNDNGVTVEIPKERFVRGEYIPLVVTAIANPSRVSKLIEDLFGVSVASELFFADHSQLHLSEINQWIEELKKEERFAQSNFILFSTEKDWVKKSSWDGLSCPLYFVEIEMEVVEGSDVWHALLDRVQLIAQK